LNAKDAKDMKNKVRTDECFDSKHLLEEVRGKDVRSLDGHFDWIILGAKAISVGF
jgi:hypothetical protein